MDQIYEPRLDRMDVGIRAVALACRRGKRSILRSLGISPGQQSEVLEAVVRLDHPLRTEDGAAELTQLCPFVLDRALVLIVLPRLFTPLPSSAIDSQ